MSIHYLLPISRIFDNILMGEGVIVGNPHLLMNELMSVAAKYGVQLLLLEKLE